jgi:hypothetical protein
MAWTTLGTVAPGDVLRANSGTAAYNSIIGNANIAPRGRVASAVNTGSNQASITTAVDLTNTTTGSFTYTNGRYYLVIAETHFASTVAGDYVGLTLNNGSDVYTVYEGYTGTSEVQTIRATYAVNNLSGALTWKLRMLRATGSGTITCWHSRRTSITVLDIGSGAP